MVKDPGGGARQSQPAAQDSPGHLVVRLHTPRLKPLQLAGPGSEDAGADSALSSPPDWPKPASDTRSTCSWMSTRSRSGPDMRDM